MEKSHRLQDGPQKVTGRARYAGDVRLPGMLCARLVLSPHAHARIVAIDSSRLQRLPGFVAVVTADQFSQFDQQPTSRSQTLLARDRVVFQGHPVAVVLAEDEATAQDAASLIEIEYEPLQAAIDPLEAMKDGAPLVWPKGISSDWSEAAIHGGEVQAQMGPQPSRRHGNVSTSIQYRRGDVDTGFRESDVILERSYSTSMVHQGYLEPHATVACFDPISDQLTIWTGTQGSFFVRAEVARALGMPEGRIRVIPMAVGGAFGGKIVLLEPLVGALAMYVRRPVRLVLTRMEEFVTATPAPQATFHLKMGARRDGRLSALQARVIFDSGAFSGSPLALACLAVGWSYRFPHLDIEGIEVLTHKVAAGAYRAPGAPSAVFATESHMDDLADALHLDPLEFRLLNIIESGDPRPDGSLWPSMGLRTCLERLGRHPLWKRRQRQDFEGYGIALSPWRGAIQGASAACKLNEDGTLRVIVGAVDITGTHTSLAVIAAETFGVPPQIVKVVVADTEQGPYAGVSSGSATTYTVGLAVQQAAADARQQLLKISAEVMEADVHDLEIADQWIQVRGTPGRRHSIAAIARMTAQAGSKYPPIFGAGHTVPPDRASGSVAHLAQVSIDPETGEVRVIRYVAVQDVGHAINPPAVEGQVHGGVAQGIGWALLERMAYDSNGQLLTSTFADYALPAASVVPNVEVELVETPLEYTPFGVRGVGEPPVVPVAAAIANAIRDATGVRVTELPIIPQHLLAAIRRQVGET